MFEWLSNLNKKLWKQPEQNAPTDVIRLPGNQPGTGANFDTRPAAEAELDVHFGEIVASASAVIWGKKAVGIWRRFPALNQNTTSACVAFTTAKILGILRYLKDGIFVVFSAGDIYDRRSNKSAAGDASQGMSSADPFSIAAQGVTLDALVPSQNLTEAQINALTFPGYAREVAQLFKLAGATPVIAPIGDIDAIASIIQTTGKGVMVWYYFTGAEWGIVNGGGGDFNTPQILSPGLQLQDAAALRHSVTAVDYTLDANGKKCLVIEDSAWVGGMNRRLVTEDFHKARNWLAQYPMNFSRVVTSSETPSLAMFGPFKKELDFIAWDKVKNAPADPVLNATQREDVIRLQQILQLLTDSRGNSYFPLNIECTGYYGATTALAVYAWQSEHTVAPQSELDSLSGKRFGAASMAAMNKLITG